MSRRWGSPKPTPTPLTVWLWSQEHEKNSSRTKRRPYNKAKATRQKNAAYSRCGGGGAAEKALEPAAYRRCGGGGQERLYDPGFLASGPPHSLAKTRKKPPSLHPKKSPTPTAPTRRWPCWTFGSTMSSSGNTSPRHFGPVVSPSGIPGLGSTMRVRTHGFSRRSLFALWRIIARKLLY